MAGKMSRTADRESLYYANQQSGIALIVVLVLVGLLVGVLVVGLTGDLVRQNDRESRTTDALAKAKEALIGYAANYRDEHPGQVFGYLPCPDVDGSAGEGTAQTACGATDATVIGRLPWKTLELPPLRDGDGECLWYAVSGNFKNNPQTGLMNWDTNGLIEIMAPDGTNYAAGGSGTTAVPTRRAAAVIYAAGAILPGQDRSLAATNPPTICGGNYNAANYLDTDTASTINNSTATSATVNARSRYIAALNSSRTAAATDSFNDRLAFITPDDIFADHAQKRSDFLPYLTDPNTGMLRAAADCIVQYGKTNLLGILDKRLPWAAPIALNNYGLASNYDDDAATPRYSGRLPYKTDNSAALLTGTSNPIVLSAGGILLTSSVCPGWSSVQPFWNNWKDHVFYAVAKAFAPNNPVAAILPDPCILDECLTVDGATGIAAVLIFAGPKLVGESRNNDANPLYTSADKSSALNYLEGVNAVSIQQNNPNRLSPRQFSKIAGNDTVMCINANPITGLYVDPTCSTPVSTCTSNANSLAGYKSGNNNNCKVGTKSVLAACQNLANAIGSANCSCKKSANDFISNPCLNGFTNPKCQNAYTALLAC